MDMNWFTHEERGFYHYTETFSYGSIRLFRNPEDMNMGIMLDLSGEGCRQLEDVFEEDNNRSWTEFLDHCMMMIFLEKILLLIQKLLVLILLLMN